MNLSFWSSAPGELRRVQTLLNICTRLTRYLYSAEWNWIIRNITDNRTGAFDNTFYERFISLVVI